MNFFVQNLKVKKFYLKNRFDDIINLRLGLEIG